MRLVWPAPQHLIVCLLISIAALALAYLSIPSLKGILSALALILVFPVPGYLALLWAYPGKGELSRRGRAILSLVASVFLAGLLGLVLWATPRGLESGSLATLLSILSLFLLAMAYMRWSDLPRNRRFFLLPRSGLRPGPNASRQSSITGRRAAYAILLLAALLIAAIALSFGPQHISWDGISSRFHEPLPDLPASKDGALFTLAKEDRPQVDPAANASSSQEVQSPYSSPNGSSGLYTTVLNATDLSSANNTTAEISGRSRDMFFSGGGGGGGTGSSKEASSKPQSKKESMPPAEEPQEPETASDSEGIDAENNLTEIADASNQISPDQSNQSINSTGAPALGETQAAGEDGLVTDALAGQSSMGSMKPGQPDEVGISSETNAPDSTSSATTASSPSVPSDMTSSAALTAAGDSALPEEGQSGGAQDKEIHPESSPAGADEALDREMILDNASSDASDINRPPILEALIPDRPSPQPPGTAIFWKANATDHEGDRLLYKFLVSGREANNWSRIGSWIWPTSGLSPGNYEISVLVRDGNHASESSFDHMINSSFALTSLNQSPALKDLISDASSPMERGRSIKWTASAIDPDNDMVYYRFLKDGEEARGWSASPEWGWNTSSESPGEYVISVLARDEENASLDSFDSSLERIFVLNPSNRIPEISELQADRSSPQPQGSVVNWTAAAVDPDGDTIYYRFLIDGLPAREWSTASSWAWESSSARPGTHSITAQARDGKHASSRDFDSFKEAAFEISAANQPPILASLLPDIASPQAQGATVAWTAGAADREGDQIFYKFLLNGRDMTGWSPSPTWQWSSGGQAPGDYRVRVLVRDGLHAPEDSFDDYKESTFSLLSEIDLQIEKLQRK